MTILEHATVVLLRDLPAHALKAGDTGVVVDIARDGAAPDRVLGYSLEIFALDGSTINVIDIPADAVRAGRAGEVHHARSVAAE